MNWKDNPKEFADEISNCVGYIREEFEANFNKVKELDRQTQDILHSLEIENLSYHEKARLAIKLEEIRKLRRMHKDVVEQFQSMNNFFNGQNTIKTLKLFADELRRIQRLNENRPNRTYRKRSKES